MIPVVIPEHMGGLHPYEHVLVLLLAFGPFVVLAIVIAVVRRRDLAEGPAPEQVTDRDEQEG